MAIYRPFDNLRADPRRPLSRGRGRPRPSIEHIVGLDLGQVHDPTALAVVQPVAIPDGGQNTYRLVHLDRAPLGLPYPDMADRVARLLRTGPLRQSALVVDTTGVGRPVVDLFRKAGLAPVAVTITGGDRITGNRKRVRVPKRELVSALQVVLQSGRLEIAEKLHLADALLEEFRDFRVRVSAAGHDSYGALGEDEHDDLIIALCLAVWYGERQLRQPRAA